MNFKKNLVSIIIRTNSINRLHLLKNAIDSIIQSNYKPIEIVIVAQTSSDLLIEKIEDLATALSDSNLQIRLVVNKTTKDERTRNLNLGIQAATGRYIGFLDDDDVIYPNHISSLIEAIQKSELIAWAYSDVAAVVCSVEPTGKVNKVSVDYPYIKDKFSKENLWKDNFIPIHSYIIDRQRVSDDLLQFDESFKVMEDYAFLLRLATSYEPQYVPGVTCEYRFMTDASNSNLYINQILGINYGEKAKIWQQADRSVEKLKKQLMPDYTSPIFSANQRKFILAKFSIIYRIKQKFPKFYNFFASNFLKIIK